RAGGPPGGTGSALLSAVARAAPRPAGSSHGPALAGAAPAGNSPRRATRPARAPAHQRAPPGPCRAHFALLSIPHMYERPKSTRWSKGGCGCAPEMNRARFWSFFDQKRAQYETLDVVAEPQLGATHPGGRGPRTPALLGLDALVYGQLLGIAVVAW